MFKNNREKAYQRNSSERRKASRRARVIRSNVGSSQIAQTRQPKNLQLRRYLVAVIVILILLWSGYTGGGVTVIGTSKPVDSKVTQSVNDYLSGLKNWWWFVSENQLVSAIKKSSPYVAEAEVRREILSRDIKVIITERRPSLRVRVDKQQFLVADDGVALGVSESGNKLPLVYDESNLSAPQAGGQYLPKNLVSQVHEISDSLFEDKNFTVKEFVLPNNTREIRAETKQGFYIKFTTSEDISSQIKDLRLVRSKIASSTEYVDVRFSGKVFIK